MAPDLDQATLIVISGDEEALRRRHIDSILTMAGGSDSLELEVYLADERPVSDWISTVTTLPFLEERRTVIVRHVLRLGDPSDAMGDWTQAMKSLPPTARLVLVTDDEGGDENRQKRLMTLRKSWEKWCVGCGGTVAADRVDAKNVKVYLKSEVKSMGLNLSDSTLDLLIEMTAGSLSMAMQELEKLALFSDGVNPILDKDVQRLVVPAREWKIYNLVDAVLEGRIGVALTEWKTLVTSGAKIADIAISRLLPTMASQLRLIWLMKNAMDLGATPSHIPDSILSKLPTSPSLRDLPEWRIKRLAGPAKKLSYTYLAHCFSALAEADAKLKGQIDAFSPEDTVEQMITSMAPSTASVS